MENKITIGLFGFGTVGQGLAGVLQRVENNKAEIKRICVKNADKPRTLPQEFFTVNPDDIFNDSKINLIVEVIDDDKAAYGIVTKALNKGLSVVSGNKKMLAYHLPELIELQQKTGAALLYDASACGSIPVIRNLEEYYDNDLLISVKGILNGSSNFILSKIFNENMRYDTALKMAQDLGFAESNPSFDVDGFDSLFKLVIITVHAFGEYVNPDKLLNFGISNMSENDIRFAIEKSRRIKLVGQVEKLSNDQITLFVLPQLISKDKYIYSVEDEFNGVVIKGEFYYKQFMFGQGAGSKPTGSAVLSDITARYHNYRYEYKKRNRIRKFHYTEDHIIRIYLRYENEDDLSLFNFQQITERYASDSYKYVVGNINLKDIIKIKDELHKRNLFLAAYPHN
ncbi:MAG: homoserine dehydrogenase [Bacteroidales bacterium]|jgi:homoserine dehydrogenase|nr:homoserine dehydrogenase [Bacteroidales bacterium]